MLLVVLAGLPASGKSEVAKVAQQMGFNVFNVGDVVRKAMVAAGWQGTLAQFADKGRWEIGPDVWMRMLAPRFLEATGPVLVDSGRAEEELGFLRRTVSSNLVVLAIHSSPSARQARLIHRARADGLGTAGPFSERDQTELRWGAGNVIAMADFMLVNDSGQQALREASGRVLAAIRRGA